MKSNTIFSIKSAPNTTKLPHNKAFPIHSVIAETRIKKDKTLYNQPQWKGRNRDHRLHKGTKWVWDMTTYIPLGHWAMIFSLREETVIDWLYLLGPISVPSESLNLSSIQSSPAMFSILFPKKNENPKPKISKRNSKTSLWGKSSNKNRVWSNYNKPRTEKQRKPKSK